MTMRNWIGWTLRRLTWGAAVLFVAGLAWPQEIIIPVEGADANDWNHETFWYSPWGASGVHRGIDIFARDDTPVLAATSGVVVFVGELGRGGLVIAILGPKWRVHYYAHLSRADIGAGRWVSIGETIGAVGRSGNAATRPPHLHYSIVTPIPHFWLDLSGPYGWQKMFFLNPQDMLLAK